MASTYTPNDAINFAKRYVKNAQIDAATIGPILADSANRMLWMMRTWEWTVAPLGPITLTTSQTYTVSDPGDFLRLEWAGRTLSNDRVEDIQVVSEVPTDTSYQQTPKKIASGGISGGNVNLLVWPVPSSSDGRIFMIYKKTATKIDSGAMGNTMQFPDEFFPVFLSAVIYYSFLFLQDPRAGEATVRSDGQVVYSGQLGVTMALANSYAENNPMLFTAAGDQV